MKYYSLDRIKNTGARYRIVFGERSSGKTFACLDEIVKLPFLKWHYNKYIWVKNLTRNVED